MDARRVGAFASRPIRGQAREIVYNVAQHLKHFKIEHNLKFNLAEETSVATGVGSTTVKKILKEGATSMNVRGEIKFSTPTGKKNERRKRIEIDDFTKASIRRKIHDMYLAKKVFPTLTKIRDALEEADIVKCSKSYLRNVMIELGFRWKKCQSKRQILIERPDIVNWRIQYIRQIKKYRSEGKTLVYIDETYVHAGHTTGKCWQSPEEIGIASPIGKGNRLIIVHGGGEKGFVENALLIFTAKQKSGDYHDSMNYENFSKWLTEKLIPKLPEDSVIIMDNASYHCIEEDKKPSSNSLKGTIKNWLVRNNINFDEAMTKSELLMLVKSQQSPPTYKVDRLLENHGHKVLRLPPYHPDLNPIELVWGAIKGHLAREPSAETLPQKKTLLEQLFNNYTIQEWEKCCEHVKNIEQKYWLSDHVMDDEIDRLIISINDDDSESDFSFSDSE